MKESEDRLKSKQLEFERMLRGSENKIEHVSTRKAERERSKDHSQFSRNIKHYPTFDESTPPGLKHPAKMLDMHSNSLIDPQFYEDELEDGLDHFNETGPKKPVLSLDMVFDKLKFINHVREA